ncbi:MULTISPECIES: hypothetical protein [Ralstonia solanacearum species complex]|uniref:Transposase n=1 Tax=Ralstonia solanacearum TaxID=305 RepID=A0A0S4WAR8_RALSL|nr:hypothetical protein [Ralstonia pseudosolanacearum]NKA06530.1 IS3 family transposase [Ralstonia solanacearum]MDO3509622.1 hypothetical protein [Ralstonia pseudosolanacearum]MDO3511926.1 hypothetical protein [Ralstonia pseudosolanacearum]MDO3536549.1 hypothetical protein [Ralstonia pseudosolanacearum]MDO3549720.1 hypothetical protein [Ralstonia pseudosolanacearum]
MDIFPARRTQTHTFMSRGGSARSLLPMRREAMTSKAKRARYTLEFKLEAVRLVKAAQPWVPK